MISTLFGLAFDATDATRLATFWAAVLDRPVDAGATTDNAVLAPSRPESGPRSAFHRVLEPRTAKNRFHPDLMTTDQPDELARLQALGASVIAEIDTGSARWTTLADPDGNEFDLIAGARPMTAPSSDYRPSPSQRVSDQVRLYEATDGAEGGTLEGKPVVILTHRGAKTAAVRKTPIMRIPDGDSYLAVASAAGAVQHPAWYVNLVAHPTVRIQDHASHRDVVARELTGVEKQRAWRIAETFWPHFPDCRASARGREIPILRLEPVRGPGG